MWTAFIVVAFGVLLCGAVLFGVALYAQRHPQPVDPNGTTVSVPAVSGGADSATRKLVVPSAAFVQSMRAHVESRRVTLAKLLKASQELRKLWAAKTEAERRAALREQRDEVCARMSHRALHQRARQVIHTALPLRCVSLLEGSSTAMARSCRRRAPS